MINVILTHDSALTYWSQNVSAPPERRLGKTAIEQALQSTRHSLREAHLDAVFKQTWLSRLPQPIDLLVARDGDRRLTHKAKVHQQKTIPPRGAFVNLVRLRADINGREEQINVLVVSPELLFVQMARVLDFHELVELGYELCGYYAISLSEKRGLLKRNPVTSPEELKSFCNLADNVRGIKKARRAARYVLANSRSPKESQISMLASLPRNLGGFEIGLPVLNQSIVMTGKVARVLGASKCIPDIYWPEIKLVIEYDSNLEHLDVETHDHDARKHNAYAMIGIELRSVTARQLYDFGAIASILREIREKQRQASGKRRMRTSDAQLFGQEELHRWLLHGARHPRQTLA